MPGQLTAAADDHYQMTIDVWEKVIYQLPPKAEYTPRFYYITAVMYSQNLDLYEQGIEYYQHVVDNWPDYQFAWHAQYFVGDYYERWLKEGGVSEAVANPLIEQAYLAVIENYPDSRPAPHVALKLGKRYYLADRWPDAAYCFETFLNNWPDNPRRPYALYTLGRVYENMGEDGLAAAMYEDFLSAAEPDDPRTVDAQARLDEIGGLD